MSAFDSAASSRRLPLGRPATLVGALALLGAALDSPNAAAQGTTAIVSRSSYGLVGDGDSDHASLSSNGRYVAYHSDAWNLVGDDTNHARDVFVLDRWTGVVERVSLTSAGAQVGLDNEWPSISANGRFVAFDGLSDDLAGGTPGTWDVFVHDRTTGTTDLASVASDGTPANADALKSSLSADGRFVAFESYATNLDLTATASCNVYRHDRARGTTQTANAFANGDCGEAWISGDGNRVSFASIASNLVAGDANGRWDVFVLDFQSGAMERASVSTTGGDPNDDCDGFVRISLDGRFVAFQSGATNLVAGDTNGKDDVFVRDLLLDATALASVGLGGAPANGTSRNPSLSQDGTRIAFESQASNLIAGDVNALTDVFVRDLAHGTTVVASRASAGSLSDGSSGYGAIAGDGRYVAFTSDAHNLVDLDNHDLFQLYAHDLEGCDPIVAETCQGGTTSHGCTPLLGATGTPSGSAGSGFVLDASGLEGKKSALVFYSLGGGKPTAWGTTFKCTSSTVQRAFVTGTGGTAGACDGAVVFDWNQYVATHPSALGAPFTGGETVSAQVWFRDPGAALGSNLSSSVWFDVCP